jgi:hypothetical protein
MKPNTIIYKPFGPKSEMFFLLDFRLRSPIFRLPTSVFGLRTSVFGLRTSDFRLPTPVFGLRTSDFRLTTPFIYKQSKKYNPTPIGHGFL